MLSILARACDRFLTYWLAGKVRRPKSGLPAPGVVPESPDAIDWPGPIQPHLEKLEKDLWRFQAPSPVPTPCKECRIIHGRALGPTDARSAVIILHGAYGEYINCEMMARSFVKQGFRALIPAAPYHLERTPSKVYSGAALFWSPELVVAGVAQWLADVYGLIQGLRQEGVERVGLVGYSIGSLAGGLAATLWPDLDFAALLAPVGHHLESIRRSRVARYLWPWMKRVSVGEAALLDRWAPRRRPLVARKALFLITLYDDLQPTELQWDWWRAWGEPAHREFGHSHISVCFSGRLYRELEAFAAGQRSPQANVVV